MKKIIAILLVIGSLLCIAACSKPAKNVDSSDSNAFLCKTCKSQISPNVNCCPECGTAVLQANNTEHETTPTATKKSSQNTKTCLKCNAILLDVDVCPVCEEIYPSTDEPTQQETYWKNWPSGANDSWHRFYSYGGMFYIDQKNNWICNIGGAAIKWENGQWTYSSSSGDYFLQYDGTDYFHIDTSDPYYSWNMHSLTGWVQLSSSGMTSCNEPQIFRDNVEALKQSVYATNLKLRIETFELMGFSCYEENGVWKCDTHSGILTYNEESRDWQGTVNIYNCKDKTWEYNVEIMIDTSSPTRHWYRYVDGRYDEGVGSYENQTDYSTGRTYNISNYGLPQSEYYNNNAYRLDEFVGIDNFAGFYIYEECNYPISICEKEPNSDAYWDELIPTDFNLDLKVGTSVTLICRKEFKNDFELSCEYNDNSITTEWGSWETSYVVPRIKLTITATTPGTTTLKVYSPDYPDLYYNIAVNITE